MVKFQFFRTEHPKPRDIVIPEGLVPPAESAFCWATGLRRGTNVCKDMLSEDEQKLSV